MPLINQAYLSPSLAKARPLRPPRGSCVYAYCVRCTPLPTVATLPYIMVAPRVICPLRSQSSPLQPPRGLHVLIHIVCAANQYYILFIYVHRKERIENYLNPLISNQWFRLSLAIKSFIYLPLLGWRLSHSRCSISSLKLNTFWLTFPWVMPSFLTRFLLSIIICLKNVYKCSYLLYSAGDKERACSVPSQCLFFISIRVRKACAIILPNN